MVTSVPSWRLGLLGVAEVTVLTDIVWVDLHLMLLGVAEGAVLADVVGVNLDLVLLSIIMVPKLGEVVRTQIFSNGITIRNDTWVTSVPG